MTGSFSPRFDILPPPQRRLWDELAEVPPEFVLYGGTAIALHLGHRQSADFGFFCQNPLDTAPLVPAIPFLANATVTQREPNVLSCVVDRGGMVLIVAAWLSCLSSGCHGCPAYRRRSLRRTTVCRWHRSSTLLLRRLPWCSNAPRQRIISTSTPC
jgi:hypothetical protein